jgi:hypothetical protein
MFSFASYLQRPGFTEWFNRRDDYSTPQHIAAESSDQPTQSRPQPQPQTQEQRSDTSASELLEDFDNGSEDEFDSESDYESESVGPSLTCTSFSY